MISIQLSKLTLILGARTIFRDLTWEIQHDQKIGLIGPNGAGKSSLLKTIVGEYIPEAGGTVVRSRGITTGYLAQQPEFSLSETAYESAFAGNPHLAEIESELERLEASLGDPVVYENPKALERALSRHQALLEDYASLGGESYPGRVRSLLLGLGLPEEDLDKPMEKLSGGQKKLVGLARRSFSRALPAYWLVTAVSRRT